MNRIVAATALAALATGAGANTAGLKGKVDLEIEPAFLKVIPDTQELLVSTFFNNNWLFPRIPDALHVFPLDSAEFEGSFDGKKGTSTIETAWPNEIMVSDDVIGIAEKKVKAFSVSGGFIVPFSKGALNVVVDTEREGGDAPRYVYFRVSPDEKKWFYHRALWIDMDGDGLKDLLSARADWTVPPLTTYKSQVVWFKNPGNMDDISSALESAGNRRDVGSWLRPWEEHLIDDGSKMGGGDTNILVRDFDGDGVFEIVVTHFWQNDAGALVWWDKDPGPNIAVYALKEPSNGWAAASYPDDVGRIVIADDIGPPFDIEFHDINGDGIDELLTSNHEEDGDKAMVIALEIPQGADFLTKPWKQHILAKGFPNRINDGMSPGQAQAFYPSKAYGEQKGADGTHMKPWIIVAGDGTGHAHLLIPKNPLDPTDWEFEERIVYDSAVDNKNGKAITIGAIALNKLEECTDIYIPAYEDKRIVVYSGCKLLEELDELESQTNEILARYGQATTTSTTTIIAAVGASAAVVGLAAVGLVVRKRSQGVVVELAEENEEQAVSTSNDKEVVSSYTTSNPLFAVESTESV